jgi:hypothetical protein
MDERIDGAIRVELAALLGPASGSHPRWAGSPAAARVSAGAGVGAGRLPWGRARGGVPGEGREARRGWRRGWVLALAATLLLVGGAAALFAGGLMPTITVPVLPAPTEQPTLAPSPTTEPPAATATPAPTPSPSADAVRPTGLAASVMNVAFDTAGVAWLATTEGVVRWKPGTATSRAYGEADGLPSATVARVAAGPDGSVWVAGAGWIAHLAPGEEQWTAWTEFDGRDAIDVGAIAVDAAGTVWAAVTAADGLPFLARLVAAPASGATGSPAYPGPWTLLPAPAESLSTPWTSRLAIDTHDAVWASMIGSSVGAIYSWDGTSWTLRGSKAELGGDPSLPGDVSIAGAAPDGSIWVTLPAMCMSASGPCPDPGGGVAVFDGTRWTRQGPEDGLLDTDVRLHVGPDGSPWATYDRHPGSISRFDGTRWMTQAATVPEGARSVGVAPDGRLWLAGSDDLFATDGSAVLHLGMPEARSPAPMPFALEPTGEEGSTDGPTGPIAWRVYAPPTGHFFLPVASAHGPVAVEGSHLRWSADGGVTWEATPLSDEGWRVMADGDDVVVYGDGAMRLSWLNGRWVETQKLLFDPAPVSVEGMAFGPSGAVAVAGASLYFSHDGITFRRATGEPSADGPTGGVPGDEGIQGGCASPGGNSWPGTGSIGPVLASSDGFVAYTAATPADWNDRPLCEPLAWTSPDGDTWTLASTTSPFGDRAWVAGIAGRDGRFVAVGGRGGKGLAWVSDDGLAWRDLGLDLGFAGWTLAADDHGWVIASLDRSPPYTGLWISSDGTAWEPLPSEVPAPGGYIGPVIAPYPGGMTISNGDQVAVITLAR